MGEEATDDSKRPAAGALWHLLTVLGRGLLRIARVTGGMLRRIFTALFGTPHWEAPAWGTWSARRVASGAGWARTHPRHSLLIILAMAVLAGAGWYGQRWWLARPKPVEVQFTIAEPARTEIEADDVEQRRPKPVVVTFDHSVAPLVAVDKDVSEGITVSPALAGTWHWDSDRILRFTPKDDWPVGTSYNLGFARALFAPQVRLAHYDGRFASAAFVATIASSEFYQDPVNPNLKRAVIDLNFTHPVNPAELERRIELKMPYQSSGVLGIGKQSTKFTVSYDKFKLSASIHSEPIEIPKDSTSIEFTLAPGVSSQRPGRAFDGALAQSIKVPGLYSLAIAEVAPEVVTNDRNEPEHVLILQTSATVHEREMGEALSVWVLPKFNPKTRPEDRDDDSPYPWSLKEVTPEILKLASKLSPTEIPAEHEYTETHSFRIQAEIGSQLFVQVAKGVKSFGGYLLGKTYRTVVEVPPFPPELKILSQGALLPLSGEKKVAVLVRDLPGLKIEIGRLLPAQLQHLVSMSDGTYARPQFNGAFGPDNVTELFTRKIPLPNLERGHVHYESVDMAQYLKSDAGDRRGVFLLTVSGYDPNAEQREEKAKARNQRHTGEAPAEAKGDDEGDSDEACDNCAVRAVDDDTPPEQRSDSRLVLVTDLGVLIKKSMDGSQDVFVQSIYTGKPVDAASVEIVGKNGVTLFSQNTDATGHVRFAKIDGLSRERAPLMVVVRKAGDLSFLPLDKFDRGLDVSRFDIGGAKNAAVADQLSAYLFSDRGIYRPGETFHVGIIAKPANWATNIAGLPLEVEVLDARGLTVKREKVEVPAGGFFETSYTTQETAPTGTYNVNLHLVRDGRATTQVGTTTVKVHEFQPDRLKVSARFSAEPSEGWLNPVGLKALVNAQNLFGTPAQSRRVTAEVTLSPAFPAFKHFAAYKFYDPQRAKEGYSETPGDATTNEAGDAQFDLGLEKYARATYRVHFLARVFEPQGGRGVAAEAATLVSELPYLVGFKADGALDYVSRGSARSVSVIALDRTAKKTAVEGLTLVLIERKYVSVLTKQSNETYKYESRKKEVVVKETPLSIPAAGLTLALADDTPGNFAYVIRDAQGLEFNRIEYAVTGAGNVTRSLERNAELQLTLNKKDYVPGEDIEVSIRAPYTGAGLITIERDRVFTHQWFKSDTLASVQKIRLPKDFEGSGYVSVQFIRDPASDEIFMSPLSYGVVPFQTSLLARTNTLGLSSPDLVKPGQTLKMKLTSAKPTRAVVFAIDEGILQVARYQMADPLGLFFQKRMLEVRTSQILDLILPEFRKLMAASAPGGDAEGALGRHLNPFKRKHDKPAVYWSGIVEVNGERDFSYEVPETFNGSMRIMAVAVNDDTIGTAQAHTTVRGDFVISPNVPLAVAPGDDFDVSVGVANNVAKSGREAPVVVTLQTSPHLQVVGDASQTIKIGEQSEAVVLFHVKAADAERALLGSATLNFVAALGAKSAKLSTDVSVRPSVPRYAEVALGSFEGSVDVPVTRRMFPQYRDLSASVSPLPLVLAGGLSSYLANFDHLCTEQIVSQAMPALILVKRPEFGKSDVKLPLARSLDDTWRILRTRQNAEGAFGLWEASVDADEFASVYTIHLLLEARERGEPVPADMVQKGVDYLQQFAASPASDLAALRVRAYAAYLLTRQMVVTTPILTSIRESLESGFPKVWQSDVAGAYLAAAYQLQKQDRVASSLIDHQVDWLEKHAEQSGDGRYYYIDFLGDNAQRLYLLSRHFPERVKALSPNVMARLIKPMIANQYNTLSSAYLILAFDAYATALGGGVADRLSIAEIDASGNKKMLPLPANVMPRTTFSPDAAKLQLANGAGVVSYYAVTQNGFDREAPKSEQRSGMEVLREFDDGDGKPVTSVKVGEQVTVKLKFRAIGHAAYNVALVDLLPGGFEAVLDTPAEPVAAEAGAAPKGPVLAGLAGAHASGSISYADVREDRVVFYGAVTPDFGEISYRIKATNSGRFAIPPAYAASMYDRTVSARSLGGQTITVEAVGRK